MADKRLWTAPNLSHADLLACLHELCGQTFPETVLTKPDPDMVIFILEHLVERLMGVSREEMNRVVPEAATGIEFPVLHEHSIPNMNFYFNLFKLLNAAAVPNFGLRDLLQTTSKNWKQCLSHIINFAKFRETLYVNYAQLTAQGEQLLEEKMRADAEHAQAVETLRLLKETIAQEEPEAQKYSQEISNLMQELAQMTKAQQSALTETKNLKAEYEAIRAHCKELDAKKQQIQQANMKLKGRLVQSPQKFKKNLAELSQRLNKEQQARGEMERKRADVDKRLLEVRKINKMLHKCLKMLEELAAEQEKVKEEKRKVKEQKAAILVEEDILRDVKLNQQAATRSLSSLKDTKLARLTESHEQRKKRLTEMTEKSRAEKIQIEKDTDSMNSRVDQIQLEIQKLQNEHNVIGRDHEENMSTLQQRLSDLFAQLQAYHRSLSMEMEAVSADTANNVNLMNNSTKMEAVLSI